LGIALASEAPLFAGLIAGIVGGIVVSIASGSPLGVSGPAAGLIAIVVGAVASLGSYEAFLVAVVLAGLIQIVLGLLKAGIIGYYFPNAVIRGMLTGIGITIVIKQLPFIFGYPKDLDGTFMEKLEFISQSIAPGSIVITVVGLAILILWGLPFMKRLTFSRILPGPLVAVITGVLLYIAFLGSSLAIPDNPEKYTHLVNIPITDSWASFLELFTLPDFSVLSNPEVYVVAMTIAVVASLETLLCVEATDKLDPEKRITPTNRELLAQGIGNSISGMIGGLPITQVIVRSSANIQAGGKSKASAFIHGIFLLVTVLAIPNILNLIPYASLAAILLMVGYKLAKPALFKEMYEKGWEQFIPFIATVVFILATDLLIGIGVGLAIAIAQILWNNYKVPYHFDQEVHDEKPIHILLSEDVSFLNKASIKHTLEQLPDDSYVILDASKTKNIHPDVIEIIEDFRINAGTRNITFEFKEMPQSTSGLSPVAKFGQVVAEQV
ncbi:MAG: SulP family inorganic anion transporter, partial [Bacteroidota bacterium]